MRRFIVVFIHKGVKCNRAVWAKSPDSAERALKALYEDAKIIGVVED